MDILVKIVGTIILGVGFMFGLCLVLSIPLWLLWNWLIPIVFPWEGIVHHITLLQSFGILFLSSILFKSTTATTKSN